MQRRKFVKDSATMAFGLYAFGNIHWDGQQFIGDRPTTTDILGPFYRPGAPLRENIIPVGDAGERLHLSGTIFRDDGKTPFGNCLVEVWQCESDMEYDNVSDDYKFRGAQKTGADGKYHFITCQPPAYPIRPGSPIYRPAHIHLRVSGEGQQDLITQVYFKGGKYLEDDPLSASPNAANRILPINRNKKGEQDVLFNIVMAKEFRPDKAVFDKISGLYAMTDKSVLEFYPGGDFLMVKWNGQIREALQYKGSNEFFGGVDNRKARFEMLQDGTVKVYFQFITALNKDNKEYKETNIEGVKVFKYGVRNEG